MRTGGVQYGKELDTLSYILHHIVGTVRHKTNACEHDTCFVTRCCVGVCSTFVTVLVVFHINSVSTKCSIFGFSIGVGFHIYI